MSEGTILVLGTGQFAGRIVFDLAATARERVRVVVAGRNCDRLDWLRAASNGRAFIYGSKACVEACRLDMTDPDAVAACIGETEPAVIVQAASPQASAVIAGSGNAWTRLIAEAGLSAMAVTQSMFSIRAARALMASGHDCHLINCAYPDVTNSMIAALGLPITCGVGNIAILAAVFPEALGIEDPSRMKLLAHYQTLTPYRYPAAERAGPFPRIWLDAAEVADAGAATRKARITREPAIEVSGASGVPLMLAMASGGTWQGHVPGPDGRPGGYPAAYREGALSLELPPGLGEPEAVSWNAAFERRNGLYVDQNGRAHYAGRLFEKLKAHSPELAQGFAVADIDAVFAEMERLRARLIATPVGGTG